MTDFFELGFSKGFDDLSNFDVSHLNAEEKSLYWHGFDEGVIERFEYELAYNENPEGFE